MRLASRLSNLFNDRKSSGCLDLQVELNARPELGA